MVEVTEEASARGTRGATDSEVFDAVVVGGGPRALSLVERLTARRRADGAVPGKERLRVALIDAVEVGPGATWRTDQTAQFLNNTTSAATTIYPDASTPIDGPLGDGPTFLEWAEDVQRAGAHPIPWVAEEARDVTPASFPSRRLQGVYYAEQLGRIEAAGFVEIERVLGLVTDLGRVDDLRSVTLADGRTFTGRTLVLAQGMVQARPDRSVTSFAEHAARTGRLYISPGMPAEKPWHLVPAGEPVIVQGLGANFFDVVAELTAGRGGTFAPVPGDPTGRLRYEASGREPFIYAGSRRGVPYRSKGDFADGAAPKFEATFATPERFAAFSLDAPGSLDFGADIWPALAADLAFAYVRAIRWRDEETVPNGLGPVERDLEAKLHARYNDASAATRAIDDVLERHLRLPGDDPRAFRLEHLRRPTGGARVGRAGWEQHVRDLVELELDSIAHPAESPRQAVNLAMGGLRGPVAKLALTGVVDGASVVRDVHGWFATDGLFLASGPPATRTREVLALIEAGIVTLIGPETRVEPVDDGRFRATSPVSGIAVTADAFVETRMSKGKVPETSDPLLRALLDTGRGRIHELPTAAGGQAPTDSIEGVPARPSAAAGDTRPPLALVNADGEVDRGVLLLGIPAGSTQPGSAIGAAPGKPSPLLTGADIAAQTVIARVEALRGPLTTIGV